MSVQDSTIYQTRHARFGAVFVGVVAAVLPRGAIAKDARACTAGTALRLSAPEASQGSLLLIELKSTKPMAEVQGGWGGRAVPLWREDGDEAQRKGLLAADLEKAPGEYELKITGQMAGGEKLSCSAMVTGRKGLCAAAKLQRGKRFTEPPPDQTQP